MNTRTGIWLVVLGLVLAGCGGSGGASDEGTDTTTARSNQETGDTEDGSAEDSEGGAGGEPQTLAEFFGWVDDPATAEADFREQEARIQESIRRCMAEQGFEYQPILPPADSFQTFTSEDHAEWVRKHGFGITTWFGNEDENVEAAEWVDPNQEMLESMSESERQAWEEALYGSEEERAGQMETIVDEATGETIEVMRGYGAGCQGEAYEAEYGSADAVQGLWEELDPALEEMYQRVEADPRIVELNEKWAECMAGAGYDGYTVRNEMFEAVYEDFQARFDELVGPNGGFGDPFEGWTGDEIDAFFEESTQEEVDALFEDARQEAMENVDMEAVRALQQEEIDLAVTDVECAEGWDDTYREVSQEYEADFIAENRGILEQIREAQGR